MKKVISATSLVVALALGAAACGSSGGSSAASSSSTGSSSAASAAVPAQKTNVSIVATFINSIPAMAALKVADQRGYFQDAGLNLSFASAIGGGDTLRPLATGDADIAIGSPAASVLAAQQNPNLKVAAIWLPYNPFYFIGTKPLPSNLNGVTLGGSVGASTVNLMIAGLNEKLGVTFQNQKAGTGSMADDWAAVKSGHLQASWAMQPFVTEMEQQQGAQVVLDPSKSLPDFPADFVVVNEKFAQQHKAAMQDFFSAIARIFGDFSNPSKQDALATDLSKVMVFNAATIKKYLTNANPQRLQQTYSLQMNSALLQNVSQLMQKAKLITSPVDWKSIVDQSYLPTADQLSSLP